MLKSLDLTGGIHGLRLILPEPGPLTRFSDDELLAASDSVFGMLDDPSDMARSELLASYDDISLEISRREDGRAAGTRVTGPAPPGPGRVAGP